MSPIVSCDCVCKSARGLLEEEHSKTDFFLPSRLINGEEEEERGEDRDAERNKQLEHTSQRYSGSRRK